MVYTEEIKDYIRVRCEQSSNNSKIAREVKSKFNLEDKSHDTLRILVSNTRIRERLKAQSKPKRRLFFDIETTYIKGWFWSCGKQYIGPQNIMQDKKVICISYKWEGDEEIKTLTWSKKGDDGGMIKKFIKVLGEADEIIAHNGDNFDLKELRTRAINHGEFMYPTYKTLDTLKKSRQYFRFPSNKLDYIGKFLNVGEKMHHEGIQMWIDITEDKCPDALAKMVKYCEQDVILLEDVYTCMSPYIYHNTNFAVLHGKDKWNCPECTSDDVNMYHTYTTPMGVIRRNMRCSVCKKQYRISNKTYTNMLVNKSLGL